MRVERVRGLDGARGARGAVVVIDVLRAFTTAAYACASGARAIELVATPEEGLARKRVDPGLVLVGEVGGRPIPGFDHGNSPERMAALDLAGRRLVLRSSSGVQGALAALPTCETLLLASLVTARATVRVLAGLGRDVTLVPMGSPDGPDGPEDDACAEHLAALLDGAEPDPAPLLHRVRASPAATQALDPACDWISPGDLELALALDRFPFALEARREADALVARRLDPEGG
ncbi:MAG TPA: 2-phosphosulfolactate phosphatase [Planctomycetota bacterium]